MTIGVQPRRRGMERQSRDAFLSSSSPCERPELTRLAVEDADIALPISCQHLRLDFECARA
jgi:hypothetical protein